jgi:transposase
MSSSYDLLVGIDWATEQHQVCLLQPDGTGREECAVEHTVPALHGFLERLVARVGGQAERLAVGIETPRGALVETLVERGLHVYALNPKQLDRFRDRHSVAGAKDDSLDAYVLADAVRTDLPKFRRVRLDEPLVLQIRELSRADEDLRGETNRLVNRFREQLYRCAAPLLQLSPAADELWFWALAERVTQQPERRVTRAQLDKLLKLHRIRRVSADQVLEVVRQPSLGNAPGAVAAAHLHIGLLLPRLRLVHSQRQQCAKQLQQLLDAYGAEEAGTHGDGGSGNVTILRSLPGVGLIVTTSILASAAQALQEVDYPALRAYGGLAPITRRSGKSKLVIMRRACDNRLRNAFYHWARTSIQCDDGARTYYSDLRHRGHSHGRALRSVADRWLRILAAMLKTRTLYDPQLPHRRELTAPA